MGDTPNVITEGGAGIATEPLPVKNDRPYIQDIIINELEQSHFMAPGLVRIIKDVTKRKEFGIKKYGTGLQAFNGRRPLVDAYQELLDAVIYLRQAYEEAKEQTGPDVLLAEDLLMEYRTVLSSAWALADLLPDDA
jgi:hypothetical protein